jgi:SAM-dependent methyltransferase
MSWDATWEDVYRAGRQLNRYPTEYFVQFLGRYYSQLPDRAGVQILDLGCGAGNNTWFAAREGYRVTALDGSPAGLGYLGRRLAEDGLRAELCAADASAMPFAAGRFDVVLDRAAIECNPLATARAIAAEVIRVLKPGGRLLAIMRGDGSDDRRCGEEFEPKTCRNFTKGTLAGLACVRFYDLQDIRDLFGGLELESAVREVRQQVIPAPGTADRWIVVLRKGKDAGSRE